MVSGPGPTGGTREGAEVAAEPIANLFPSLAALEQGEDRVVSVMGSIGDYSESLQRPERAAVARAVEKRQREFAAGRAFARIAMQALGLPAAAVPQGPQRQPLWPASMLGSISHSDRLAWVVAASRNRYDGMGADLERLDRLQADLHDKLFTAAELRCIEAGDATLATALFSAKEAVYKATNPIAGVFIGFQEVEVILNAEQSQFSMRYLGEHQPNAVMELGTGYLRIAQEHALALFLIPHQSAS